MSDPYEAHAASVAPANGNAAQTPTPPMFSASLTAGAGSVDTARRLLRSWLDHCRADEWRRDDIALAVADACADVVYRVQPGTRTGRLTITADIAEHELHVTVTDTTVGRSPTDKPDARLELGTVSALSSAVMINATKEGAAVLLTFTPAPARARRPAE